MPELVVEVAPDVFLGRGTDVNWVLARDGADVTLIDAGYPGDAERVAASIRAIGRRPQDVVAVLVTHAHIDHLGGVPRYADRPVYTGPAEVGHVRREYLEQASPLDVARNLWRPGLWPWLARVLRVGVLADVRVPAAQPLPGAGALDLPGRPVAVATPGHTSGHTAYLLPGAGVVATGDALVTGHPALRRDGPSVLPAFFNAGDPVPALAALGALDADVILPGHGEPLHRPVGEAVAEARERAISRARRPARPASS